MNLEMLLMRALLKGRSNQTSTNSGDVVMRSYQLRTTLLPFINASPTKLATGSTALKWWSSTEQRAAYPALSQMAIDCLSAFAMSAESERIFSKAKRLVIDERSNLSGDSIERAECSKDWQCSGLAYVPIDDHLAALDAYEDDIMKID